MDKDYVVAQAEQDQLWMDLDTWYVRNQDTEELTDLVELLSIPPLKDNLKRIRKEINIHGIEVVRLLALHTLRELALRRTAARERTITDDP